MQGGAHSRSQNQNQKTKSKAADRSIRSTRALRSQVLDVDVCAKSYVVGEVPAFVVGIVVDDDVVAIPEPVVAEAEVIGRDAEIKTAEPEATGAATAEVPDVAAADAAGEASVLPGMVEVVVNVVAASVMADPFAVGVDVRSVRVTGLVVEVTLLRGCGCGMRRACWRGTVGGDVSSSTADAGAMLS